MRLQSLSRSDEADKHPNQKKTNKNETKMAAKATRLWK